MNEPLAQLFRYNRWANARVIEACAALTDADLEALPGAGAFGSIRETLFHVITGECDFLARLEGRARDEAKPDAWAGFDDLRELAERTDAALIAAAEALAGERTVVVVFMDKRPEYPASFFLTHAVAHGIEHRAQIIHMLGAAAPDLDGWAYAADQGFGHEG